MLHFRFYPLLISSIMLLFLLLLPTPSISNIKFPSVEVMLDNELGRDIKKDSNSLKNVDITVFFSHHQKKISSVPQKNSNTHSTKSPAVEEKIEYQTHIAAPLQSRFTKLGQSTKNNRLSFFIKDSSSGIIYELIPGTSNGDLLLLEDSGLYYIILTTGERHLL